MKVFRLLLVPATLLFSVVVATPVLAHGISNVTVSTTCNRTNGQICIKVAGTIESGNDVRVMKFDLVGVDAQGGRTPEGEVQITLPENHTGQPVPFTSDQVCFPAVTAKFDHFLVVYAGTVDNLDLHVTDTQGNTIRKGESVGGSVQPCTAEMSPSPSPSPLSSSSPAASASPSVSPSAVATVALAQTGGFDFRFPLIGLTLLVAGIALFLVSASRRRSASK